MRGLQGDRLEHALGADHDVGQGEPIMREGRKQLAVESGSGGLGLTDWPQGAKGGPEPAVY